MTELVLWSFVLPLPPLIFSAGVRTFAILAEVFERHGLDELHSRGGFSRRFLVSTAASVYRTLWTWRVGQKGDREHGELIAEFPLTPINDDHAYSRAIAILDGLFDLGDARRREMEYFDALALLACEYEERRGPDPINVAS